MAKPTTLSRAEVEQLDRIYREGGLRTMDSPHVHYDDPACPHPGCGHRMEWIDFKLELHGDPEGIYRPLARAWWDGTGFLGRCPACGAWVRFRTIGMTPGQPEDIGGVPELPVNWAELAPFA